MAVKQHIFSAGYLNNFELIQNKDNDKIEANYLQIKNVRFHDISWFVNITGEAHIGSLYGTLMPSLNKTVMNSNPSAAALQGELRAYANSSKNIDHMNKILSMMYMNWNGAEIEHGDFETGNNYIISSTPEFLYIFNRITELLYNNVTKYHQINNRIRRQKITYVNVAGNAAGTNNSNTSAAFPSSVGSKLNDYEILNIVYVNTSAYEHLISIPQNDSVPGISGATFKTPDGVGVYVMVSPNGFGEISFLRRDNIVYVRGL
jgi:hypothetical protein